MSHSRHTTVGNFGDLLRHEDPRLRAIGKLFQQDVNLYEFARQHGNDLSSDDVTLLHEIVAQLNLTRSTLINDYQANGGDPAIVATLKAVKANAEKIVVGLVNQVKITLEKIKLDEDAEKGRQLENERIRLENERRKAEDESYIEQSLIEQLPREKIAEIPAQTASGIKLVLGAKIDAANDIIRRAKLTFVQYYERHPSEKAVGPNESQEIQASVEENKHSRSRQHSESQDARSRSVSRARSESRRSVSTSSYEGEGEDDNPEVYNSSNQDVSWFKRNKEGLMIAGAVVLGILVIAAFTAATIFTFGATGVIGAGVAASGGMMAAGFGGFSAIGAMSAGTAALVVFASVVSGIVATGLSALLGIGFQHLRKPSLLLQEGSRSSRRSSSVADYSVVGSPEPSQQRSRGSSYSDTISSRLSDVDFSQRRNSTSVSKHTPQASVDDETLRSSVDNRPVASRGHDDRRPRHGHRPGPGRRNSS